jgi:succinate dehydrogenase/fumarate reductase flavoprotein subunit
MYDTVKGSDWLGDQDAIHYMCRWVNAVSRWIASVLWFPARVTALR